MVSVVVALSLKIATASTSREISLVNDYEDVTTRYVLEQLLILAGNDQSDFSESPLRLAALAHPRLRWESVSRCSQSPSAPCEHRSLAFPP